MLSDAALSYLRSGLCVLPAIRAQKRPALTTWKLYQERLPDPADISAWPASADAVCLLTGKVSGNLELIDFDYAAELYPAWCELVDPELLAKLVIERSQSGGMHVVYRCAEPVPGNQKLAQRTIAATPGEIITVAGKEHVARKVGDRHEVTLTLIETRGEGGLFLCAPTPGYELVQGTLDQVPTISEAERIALFAAAKSLSEAVSVSDARTYSGSDAGRPGDDYSERGDVRALLQRHGWQKIRDGENEHWRRPGKEAGVSATLRDGVFYCFSSNAAPFEPDTAYSPFGVYTLLECNGDFAASARQLRSEGFGSEHQSPPAVVDRQPSPADPGQLPVEMYRCPGFISDVMDHCLATAPYPNPHLAFCGAFALQATLAGRKVRDESDNRTNLYLLGLAFSASGKDHPRKINTRILHAVGLEKAIGDRFASSEGIQDALAITPVMLFQTDEIDGLLQSINKSRDARHENIMGTLLTMYSAANSIYPGRRKSGADVPAAINQPCLVIFGTAIPTHYYGAMSDRMLTNGLVARMIAVEGGRRAAGQDVLISELPESVIDTARWWVEYRPGGGDLAQLNPEPRIVSATEGARHVLSQARLTCEAEYAQAEELRDAVGTTIWGRVHEHARKLALLYAVSANHAEPEISEAAAEWAVSFALHHARRMLYMAAVHVADNPFHAECLKLLKKLREAPGGKLPHSVLLKRMKCASKDFDAVIATLIQQGEIEVVSELTSTKPSRCYAITQG